MALERAGRHVSSSPPDQPERRPLVATRRMVLGSAPGMLAASANARTSFAAFLADLKSEAAAAGISRRAVESALALTTPNQRVIQLDRHQPEFTLTWTEYRARVLPEPRLERARSSYDQRRATFQQIEGRYGVDPGVIVGIWGLESSFGEKQGTFNVCDALATLAFDGRRRTFFRGELINALTIVDRRSIDASEMLGSYAGAMGQPQFMPSAYLRFAQAFDGGARADIWRDERDVFASIANYLARSGWRSGEPWGQPVELTKPLAPSLAGRGNARTLSQWSALGVRRTDGRSFSRGDVVGALLLPDGAGGEAFMVYRNFGVIRRYNPSDFYALGVGLLGDQIA